ncbi:hypothetical protein LOK49_Contig373G00002 [Camellia lanceoleosa]|nr:hypothetical protein LOK49_Contig373G00002 [Camellia lanceoleosa]
MTSGWGGCRHSRKKRFPLNQTGPAAKGGGGGALTVLLIIIVIFSGGSGVVLPTAKALSSRWPCLWIPNPLPQISLAVHLMKPSLPLSILERETDRNPNQNFSERDRQKADVSLIVMRREEERKM